MVSWKDEVFNVRLFSQLVFSNSASTVSKKRQDYSNSLQQLPTLGTGGQFDAHCITSMEALVKAFYNFVK